jgi:energy-coupling factor transporter ATP-binding protein EcfA2
MYEAFYRLSGKPFQLNPDPDFFFGSRGHRRAMAYLEYGLHQGEGFIVITGEVGAGKTTLVRNLLRRIPAETIVPAQVSTATADDLLRGGRQLPDQCPGHGQVHPAAAARTSISAAARRRQAGAADRG